MHPPHAELMTRTKRLRLLLGDSQADVASWAGLSLGYFKIIERQERPRIGRYAEIMLRDYCANAARRLAEREEIDG